MVADTSRCVNDMYPRLPDAVCPDFVPAPCHCEPRRNKLPRNDPFFDSFCDVYNLLCFHTRFEALSFRTPAFAGACLSRRKRGRNPDRHVPVGFLLSQE